MITASERDPLPRLPRLTSLSEVYQYLVDLRRVLEKVLRPPVMRYAVPIDPQNLRDGVMTIFPSPVRIAFDDDGRAKAVLYRGASADLWADPIAPPIAGEWTVVTIFGIQAVVTGIAPAVGEYFAFLHVEVAA